MTEKGIQFSGFNPNKSELLAVDGRPRVSETVFITHVLDLLCRPYDPESLLRYRQFVPHLIHPLNVMSDNDPNEILFTVPALAPPPSVSIARTERGGMSASAFIDFANTQQERGVPKDKLLEAFFSRTVHVPDPYEKVIKPILEILDRYQRVMLIETPSGTLTLSWAELTGRSVTNPTSTLKNKINPYSDDMVL